MDRNRGRRRQSGRRIYRTTVNGVVLQGFADQIVAKCEGLGYEARRDKDEVAAQRFFQTADHYKRIENNDDTAE